MKTTTIYLVRHAQSRPTNRLAESEWPLSDLGHRQARDLSGLLEPLTIEHIVCSPYARCLHTIQPFAGASGLDIAIEPGLRERRITNELRRDFEQVLARSWEDFGFALPGCESSAATQERMTASIGQIADRYAGKCVAVCSHGNAISLLLNSLESGFGLTEMWALRNPDVIRLLANEDGLRWDRDFDLPGLSGMATLHRDSPIEW